MVTTAEMEIFVNTCIDRASEKIEYDYKLVLTEAVEKMKNDVQELKEAAAGAEQGRQNAMNELPKARDRELVSVANRENAEEMIQSAHRDITEVAMKLGQAGAGVLPVVEKRIDSRIGEEMGNVLGQLREVKDQLTGAYDELKSKMEQVTGISEDLKNELDKVRDDLGSDIGRVDIRIGDAEMFINGQEEFRSRIDDVMEKLGQLDNVTTGAPVRKNVPESYVSRIKRKC